MFPIRRNPDRFPMNCTRNNLMKCVVQSRAVIQVCFTVSFGCWIAPLNQVLNHLLWTAYWSLSLIPGSCDVYILPSRFVCIPHLFNHARPRILIGYEPRAVPLIICVILCLSAPVRSFGRDHSVPRPPHSQLCLPHTWRNILYWVASTLQLVRIGSRKLADYIVR